MGRGVCQTIETTLIKEGERVFRREPLPPRYLKTEFSNASNASNARAKQRLCYYCDYCPSITYTPGGASAWA